MLNYSLDDKFSCISFKMLCHSFKTFHPARVFTRFDNIRQDMIIRYGYDIRKITKTRYIK